MSEETELIENAPIGLDSPTQRDERIDEKVAKSVSDAISNDDNAVPDIPISNCPPLSSVVPLNLLGETLEAMNVFKELDIDLFTAPKPECVTDPECPAQLSCINEKCKDPCYSHRCGRNAKCTVKNHRPICVCLEGFVGNPETICEERK